MLKAFGCGKAMPPPDRPLFEKKVIMLGRPPHRIDLITDIDGVSFEETWSTRIEDELDGLPVSFISRELLLNDELAASRDKDLADAKMLERLIAADERQQWPRRPPGRKNPLRYSQQIQERDSVITISYDDLDLAMESRGDDYSGMRSYLDRETGEVLTVSNDDAYDDPDPEVSERIDEEPARYAEIPALDSRESYRELVRFAESIDEEDIRDQLEVAMAGGRGVFGRFHHVIGKYPDLRERWHAVERENRARRMRDWFEEEGIEAELRMPPALRSVEVPPEKKKAVHPGLLDVLLVGAPDGKTELIEGRVWRQLTAKNQQEARAAFTRLAREACEMSGVAWRKRLVQDSSRLEVGRFILEHEDLTVAVSVEIDPAVWLALSQ